MELQSVQSIIDGCKLQPTNKNKQWELSVANKVLQGFRDCSREELAQLRGVLTGQGEFKIRNLKNKQLDLLVAMANAFMARIDVHSIVGK